MLSPSNGGGDEPGSGLPAVEECITCSSSSCTRSSQDMDGDRVMSIASLKAICRASGSFVVLPRDG